jgi:anti-sigma28 factor (negative regulator of flagellin synthesis)
MKVNDPTGAGVNGLGKAQPTSGSSGTSRSRESGGGRGDQVQLSSLSSFLSALRVDSPERTARLSHLSEAVSSGRYAVDAHALSGKLIAESMG